MDELLVEVLKMITVDAGGVAEDPDFLAEAIINGEYLP